MYDSKKKSDFGYFVFFFYRYYFVLLQFFSFDKALKFQKSFEKKTHKKKKKKFFFFVIVLKIPNEQVLYSKSEQLYH